MKIKHLITVLPFAVVALAPICALVAGSINAAVCLPDSLIRYALPAGRRLVLLVNSVTFGITVACSAMFIGVLIGSVLMKWRTFPGVYLRWFVLLLAAVPPYVHALAWSDAMFRVNGFLEYAGLAGIPFGGWGASWWVQVMSCLPIAAGLGMAAMDSVDTDIIDSARCFVSDVRTLWLVALPMAMPLISAGAGFIFVLSMTDYSIPSLFQKNVYAMEIFAEYSAASEPAGALLLSLPLVLITLGVVMQAQGVMRDAAQQGYGKFRPWTTRLLWPAWFRCLQFLALVCLALHFIVPIVSLISQVWNQHGLPATLMSHGREIFFSVAVAGSACLVCVPIAAPVAGLLDSGRKSGRLWWVLTVLPLAVPAPLAGIGLILMWNHVYLHVYGTVLMPVLAGLARFTPYAVLLLAAQRKSIDPDLIDATRLYQRSWLETLVKVRIPLMLPGVIASAALVFALTLGELGATLIVVPAGSNTLTLRIYNLLHYGASDMVAGLCLMVTLAVLVSGMAGLGGVYWRARVGAGGRNRE